MGLGATCISGKDQVVYVPKCLTILTPRRASRKRAWDKREEVDPADFTIEKQNDVTVGRVPGKVNGQQFIIRDCKNSNIYIFDHMGQVTIDDCINCKIFLGPIKTSIFIRDCKECIVMTACQQLRTRDCQRLTLFLCCVSQPIIEASSNIKFACFQYYYPQLEAQFKSSGLSVYNNNWSFVHDFTPVPGENNAALLSIEVKIEDLLPLPEGEMFESVAGTIDYNKDKSVVPFTYGKRRKTVEESCLVVFFNDGTAHSRATKHISTMNAKYSHCLLVKTKEMKISSMDAQQIFGTDGYSAAVQQGPVIGLEYSGGSVCQACQETVMAVSTGTTGLAFTSSNSAAAEENIEKFFSHADMQMDVI